MNTIPVGSTWKGEGADNPFDAFDRDWMTVEVLAVQAGWVQIRRRNGQNDSMTVSYFLNVYKPAAITA